MSPPSPVLSLGPALVLFLGLALGTLAGLRSETSLPRAEHLLRDIAGPLHMHSAAERPRTVVTPVSSHGLTHVPGKRQTTVLVTFPPGAFTPEHHHGGSVYVYVLSGTIRSQLAGEPPGIYGPGDSFFEPLGTTHLFAENVSATEPAQALAVFVHDEGATLTTYH
jgi:quercetin dioxygenase-like cupin family protein